MPILELRNISRRFAIRTAAAGVNLNVEQGQFYGLLGPSGCGKTTLLRIIAGLEIPNEGTVHFDGRDITKLSPEARGFGLVFQNYALFPHLNVFKNVSFGLRARGLSNSEVTERTRRALELVQLPGFEDRSIRELSGGQQQRIAIARAISIEPALLLFDEPLSNLDVSLRENTRRELRDLVTRLELTAIYVTHDQDDAFALCDQVSVMDSGTILQTGSPHELYTKPACIRVARFLGRNNLISAMRVSNMQDHNGVFKTLDGKHLLRVQVSRDQLSPVNEPCVLAIRPEHIQIRPLNSHEVQTENEFEATLYEKRFFGSTMHAILDAGGLRLEALQLGNSEFSQGDRFLVSLPTEHLRLLKE